MSPVWHNKVTFTVTTHGRRTHKKTYWMSEAYHRRIQKKWDKAFMESLDIEVRFVDPPRDPNKVYPRMFGEDIFTVRQHG